MAEDHGVEGSESEGPAKRGQPDVTFDFEHHANAPAKAARAALHQTLNEPDGPLAWKVKLAASELVTNVVRHTAHGGTMRAWTPNAALPFRLEVEDADPTTWAAATAHEQAGAGGRGLHIVAEISDAWGVIHGSTGKVVWAEFNRSNRSRLADDGDENRP